MVSTPEGLGLRVRGVVQGVGFRPFVYRLATRLGLSGYVKNTGEGVFIAVFGEPEKVKLFIEALRKEAPPLARIDAIEALPLTEPPPPLFTVLESTKGKYQSARIPPDVATCKACLSELFDPSDRRYRYPFINCTDCGPRFTVIEGLPYDREKTTMRKFAMCPDCLAEYTNPLDRRFHAEPNACPVCGPRIWVTDRAGRKIETQDPLALVIKALKEGKIVALKGLGG
ncbi:MAG TPA: carbamoyltransferase HypF, partial [Thermodesulfatator atlanticus]|nr:carbamoyltransferase HypF [Thermodesulfatator atlanticus]